jgi:hypothetical protein
METGPDASAPLLVNGLAPQYWLDLPAGAHLVAKHPRTAREATFRGPGRVKVCVALEDESWVASGGFNGAAASSVVAPGSEEWVVTPFGVVRSATASLSVDVYPGGARVVITSGDADIWVPADASVRQGPSGGLSKGTDDWIRAGVDTFSLFNAGGAAALTLSGARAALGTCAALAGSTRSRGRAACAVAGLRLGYLPPSSATASLNDQLTQGVALWNSLPDPSAGTPSP